jgi:CHAT domain-containing protein
MLKPGQIDKIEAKFQEAETDYYEQGKFEKAIELYSDILTELLHLQESPGNTLEFIPSILVVVERLVDLSVIFGEFRAADDLLEGMAGLHEQDGDGYGTDYTLVKRIHINLMFGHLRDAYGILESMSASIGDIHAIEFSLPGLEKWEAGVKWPGKDELDRQAILVRLYLVIGMILASLGQYSDSIAAFERGMFHCDKQPSDFVQEASLPLHLMLAEASLEKGEFTRAANQLEKLHKTIDPLTQPGHYVHSLELSGKLSLLRGEFGNVLACFKEILSFCRERRFSRAAAQTALNLARVMILLNQVGEAGTILADIKDYFQKTGDQITERRVTLLNHLAYARSHSLIDGTALPPSVTEMRRGRVSSNSTPQDVKPGDVNNIDPFVLPQSNDYLAFFEDRAMGFYWNLANCGIAETENYLAGLFETFKHTDSRLISVRLETMRGLLAYYKNIQNPLEAENILNKTIPILKELGLKPDLWQVLRVKRWCAARLNRSQTEQKKLILQTDALLTEMAGTLAGADRAIYLLNKWTVEEEKLKVKIEELEELEKKCKAARITRLFLKWRLCKQLNALVIAIDAKKDIEAKRLLKEEEIAEQEKSNRSYLWSLLKPSFKRMTLSFLVLPDRVLLTYRKWFSFGFKVIPITRIEIREKVKQWHQLMVNMKDMRDLLDNSINPDNADHDFVKLEKKAKEIAAEIAQQLQIPGILKKLPGGSSLKIIPDDVLHGFPFAGIFYDGKYLVERYALSIDFEHHSKRDNRPTFKANHALLVGVSEAVMGKPPLVGVPKEIKQIETWYESCGADTVVLDKYAKKPEVLKHLAKSTYFHISCHGAFKPDKPGESGLFLVPAPGEAVILSIRELSKLNLAGLEHATLSSCWSADNFIVPGRIIISLPEILRRAGAASILGALWPIHDTFAMAFMKRFHENLEKYPRDKALRQTQLDCINNKLAVDGGIKPGNPSHWAAFNLYGTAKRLPIPKSTA